MDQKHFYDGIFKYHHKSKKGEKVEKCVKSQNKIKKSRKKANNVGKCQKS